MDAAKSTLDVFVSQLPAALAENLPRPWSFDHWDWVVGEHEMCSTAWWPHIRYHKIANQFVQSLFEHSNLVDLGRLHCIGSWHLRIGYVSWICFFGNLKQVPLEHFAKSDCLRCDLLRCHTFLDDGHWKTNRIIRRPRPLLQSIFANFGDVEDVWAALLSSWAYEGNCPQSNWLRSGNLHGICKVWVLPTQKFQCVDFFRMSQWPQVLLEGIRVPITKARVVNRTQNVHESWGFVRFKLAEGTSSTNSCIQRFPTMRVPF